MREGIINRKPFFEMRTGRREPAGKQQISADRQMTQDETGGVSRPGPPSQLVCDVVRRSGRSLHRHEQNLDRSSSIGETEGSSGKNNTEGTSGFASPFLNEFAKGA